MPRELVLPRDTVSRPWRLSPSTDSPVAGRWWWPNNFCFSILCSPPPLPPALDLWNLSVQKSLSGEPAIAPSVTARLLTLAGLAAGKASSVFQDFIRKQIYSNQHGQGTFGFCACATR